MNVYKTTRIVLFCVFVLSLSRLAFCQDHIKDLDAIRSSMTDLGNVMPETIRSAQNRDIRTLERVFEINNYALTTVEAYFKMIKVAVSAEGSINKEIVDVFNGWLQFINKYCQKDIEYLDEAMAETEEQKVKDIITRARKNIQTLGQISVKAIEENKRLLR